MPDCAVRGVGVKQDAKETVVLLTSTEHNRGDSNVWLLKTQDEMTRDKRYHFVHKFLTGALIVSNIRQRHDFKAS